MLTRALRITAGLMLIGTGLALLSALVQAERVMYSGHVVAKALRSTKPASTPSMSHSRHS